MSFSADTPVELLAPAGTMEALHAAVCAGADAVYLGLTAFNARRGAENFTLEAFEEACDYAHLRGVSVYVTLNTVVLPDEMPAALALARQSYERGADAFIVQDIGLSAALGHALPDARLHISTQMNTINEAGIRAASLLGASRITLARELSLEEIARLAKLATQMSIEIETFAHGALCLCYSGQCYLSSLIGGRSANRGLCAQACRLPYELRDDGEPLSRAQGEHLLSPKDLATIKVLPRLIEAGVASLKIEGRMKSPDYVYAVTSVYRVVLDRIAACDSPAPSEEELQILEEAFSRGFTTAYIEGHRGNDIMSYKRPNNRGVLVGRVAAVQERSIAFRPQRPLHKGDLLEIWTRKGNTLVTVDSDDLDSALGENATFALPDARRVVSVGDRVFRVRNAELGFREEPYAPRILLRGAVTLELGKPLEERFTPSCEAMRRSGSASLRSALTSVQAASSSMPLGSVSVQNHIFKRLKRRFQERIPEGVFRGDPVEPARTIAVNEKSVRDHVNRLGATPYELARLSVTLNEGVGISFSALHRGRTEALDNLSSNILASYHGRTVPQIRGGAQAFVRHDDHRRASSRNQVCGGAPDLLHDSTHAFVAAIATNPDCAWAAQQSGAERLYIPAVNHQSGEEQLAGVLSHESTRFDKSALPYERAFSHASTPPYEGSFSPEKHRDVYPRYFVPLLPTVDHDREGASREALVNFDPWTLVQAGQPVLVDNLGDLVRAKDCGAVPEAGPHLPLLNEWALREADQLGAYRIWLSPELALTQIRQLGACSPLPLGLTIIGRQELMICEHCLLMSQGPCDQQCSFCSRRCRPMVLRDRKGYEFPVVTDLCGRSHLYNSIPLDVAHVVPDLLAAGVTGFLVDTTLMDAYEASQAVSRAVQALERAGKNGERVPKVGQTTSGHLFRGIS